VKTTPTPSPIPEKPAKRARPTTSRVLINSRAVAFAAYNIEDHNYFMLGDLAYALKDTPKRFSIRWDGANNTIVLKNGEKYEVDSGLTSVGEGIKTPRSTTSKILLDGKEISLTAYNIDNHNYFMLGDVAKTFDFFVGWDGATNTITIDTSKEYNL
jgi:hypothetical protein